MCCMAVNSLSMLMGITYLVNQWAGNLLSVFAPIDGLGMRAPVVGLFQMCVCTYYVQQVGDMV